jgi:hypothetical protein
LFEPQDKGYVVGGQAAYVEQMNGKWLVSQIVRVVEGATARSLNRREFGSDSLLMQFGGRGVFLEQNQRYAASIPPPVPRGRWCTCRTDPGAFRAGNKC